MFYSYRILNKINNKKYFGKSNNPTRRFEDHKHAKDNYPIHTAMRHHGFENFEMTIVGEFETELEAYNDEIRLIAEHKTNINKYGNEFGYNLTDGGEGVSGRVYSEEEKQHLSFMHTGEKNHFYGKHHSDETKLIISTKAKERLIDITNHPMYGKHHSDETKAKIAIAHEGKEPWNTGMPHPEETKAKISESLKGKCAGEKHVFFGKKRPSSVGEKISRTKRERGVAIGESNPNSKLTPILVQQIRSLYKTGQYTYKKLAQMFTVGQSTIARVITNKNWKSNDE